MNGKNYQEEKLIVATLVGLALVSIMALPSVAFAAEETSQKNRVLRARGLAFERIENDEAKLPANLTLTLQPGKINRTVILFSVVDGQIEVNGVKYAIKEGRGLVAYHKSMLAMQLSGASPDGDTVTVKIGGRYFWLWGRLHAARLVGTLKTSNCEVGLLLRSAIRPEQ